MVVYGFKKILPVPTAKDFIDIVLTRTQRKTPTQIHKGMHISRIRSFYMRKVRYTSEVYHEKLNAILTEFPKLDTIHPFYSDLMNVLFDRDHYKLALGQIRMAMSLIDNISTDHIRLLKHADSLMQTKSLKRAALGRMCTVMRKQAYALAYLEQVRQYLMRLPSIDPSARSLVLCGFPNVGKSSFMNSVTRANVEVESYAFTTKTLFVGHTNYKLLDFQVIDTPGILDHPLEERNTIEMQSVTALAHLQAAIVFVMDPSEQCSYTLEEQISLFEDIKPLFANKPLVIVLNKTDCWTLESLEEEDSEREHSRADIVRNMLNQTDENITVLMASTMTKEGVDEVKKTACERILASRVEAKLAGRRTQETLASRMHVSQPVRRDDAERPRYIPETVMQGVTNPERVLSVEKMNANGGAGVYKPNTNEHKLLPAEWRDDIIPEFLDGKNVADFIDPDIAEKLAALEEEEDRMIEEATAAAALDEEDPVAKARAYSAEYQEGKEPEEMPDNTIPTRAVAAIKRKRALLPPRDMEHFKRPQEEVDPDEEAQKLGVKDNAELEKSKDRMKKHYRREIAREARKGESDRHVFDFKPKHLFSGKTSLGTRDWR
ncbi:Nucleolar GTP-binding protein 1 [Carpediemonas membranifera]|uniref:Nucleolar GTP-binding protein 1 n=1 Tax=Carpediemonas membranifera TaxID=201153 RepID=A0A8J6B7P0_9EUKA|nr:Nucleolar GTP-binding protein 1 [Carpediemonas membranifera]|eukprot:KAG9394844.1 Nucleolar GTP-binding protein 1 [Carpediemonas membranifera]